MMSFAPNGAAMRVTSRRAIESPFKDGDNPEILETRVTQTRKSRNAFDGYSRGLH